MQIKDNVRAQRFGGLSIPKLKGHVKVTLHNCRTRKNEVFESDNIVSNVMRDLFALNYLGGINYANLLPEYSKWFGGILCYDQAHVLDPDNYFPQAGYNLTAHAGDQAPATAEVIAEDFTRGSPLSITRRSGEIAMSWEWGSEQGNGYIRGISLTHKDTGNAGLGNNSSQFQSFQPFANLSGLPNISTTRGSLEEIHAMFDENHALSFYIGEAGAYQGSYADMTSSKVTVNINNLAFFKAGLYETLSPNTDYNSLFRRTFTVDTAITFYMQPAFWFDYENKYLWLFTNITGYGTYREYTYSNNKVKYAVIDCNTGTLRTSGEITNLEHDFAPVCAKYHEYGDDRCPEYSSIPFDGTIIYLPTGSSNDFYHGIVNITGWRKIDITNQADQTYMPMNTSINYIRPGVIGGALAVGDGIVGNGNASYKCSPILTYNTGCLGYSFSGFNKLSSFVFPLANFDQANRSRLILANKMVNTTLWNPEDEIHKTTAKAMQIEYTLTEVGDES